MNFEIAKEKAISYLMISKKTEYEIREKLKKLKCEDDVIEKVIHSLINLNYINDSDYVDAYIRQCMRLLNYSVFEIKQKLLQKGIKKYIIEEKIENSDLKEYEINLINKLLTTKLKSYEPLKQKQYLFRRGFKLDSLNEEY